MAEDAKDAGGRNRRRWWRLYVHKVQQRYAIMVAVLLLAYSGVIFGLALVGPSITLSPKAASQLPLSERAAFATRVLFGTGGSFPAIVIVLVPGAVLFSFYLTHRFAGPLYRLEVSAKEWAEGNLALRARLRQGDDLQELADALNAVLTQVDQSLGEIRNRRTTEQGILQAYLEEVRKQPPSERVKLEELELVAKEGEQIDLVLQKFRLSAPQ